MKITLISPLSLYHFYVFLICSSLKYVFFLFLYKSSHHHLTCMFFMILFSMVISLVILRGNILKGVWNVYIWSHIHYTVKQHHFTGDLFFFKTRKVKPWITHIYYRSIFLTLKVTLLTKDFLSFSRKMIYHFLT